VTGQKNIILDKNGSILVLEVSEKTYDKEVAYGKK